MILKVSRPLAWPVFAIMFSGGLIVSGAGTTPLLLLQIAVLTLPYSLVIYGLNDIYDFESDVRNDRKGGFEGEVLPPRDRRTVLHAAVICSVLLLAVSALTFNPVNFAGAVLLLAGAVLYSVPPFRLKERPPLDSVSNGIGYIIIPAAMGYSFGASVWELPAELLWMSIVGVAVHSVSTIVDYRPDAGAGFKTFATRFGKRNTAIFVASTIVLILVFSPINSLLANVFLTVFLITALILAVRPDEELARKLSLSLYSSGMLLATVYLINLRYTHIF